MRCRRPPPPTAAPAVGASRYISEKLRILPTCPAAAQPQGVRVYVKLQITPGTHMYQILRHSLLDAMLPRADVHKQAAACRPGGLVISKAVPELLIQAHGRCSTEQLMCKDLYIDFTFEHARDCQEALNETTRNQCGQVAVGYSPPAWKNTKSSSYRPQ